MTKKQIIIIFAFISTVFCFDMKSYEPKQITTSTSSESDIVIKDDNTIYFASDRSGNYDVFKKDMVRETVSQITFQPSNEYPVFYDGKILMRSDETDIYGNIYYLTEKGEQELLYLRIGKELNPVVKNGKMFYSEENKDVFILKSFDLKKRKKPKQIKEGIGKKALLFRENELIYQTKKDASGFNNLFISAVSETDSSEASEPLQITFGQKIITGFDVSKDEKVIVYSAITTDTNGDTKLDMSDNSILYRIAVAGENFSDPLQLTSESYSSFEPKIAPNGNIFYISGRKGNPDIWSCGPEGVAPYKNSHQEQKELSDYLLENYKAKVLLSEALGEKTSEETNELLANALLSYYRTVTFSEQTDDKKADAYFKIAEIYEIQGKYRMAESIYRILQSRFQNSEYISGTAEFRRVSAELSRKGISIKDYGYELDEHIRYLNYLLEKYKDASIKNLINLRIGEIYYNLKSYQTANGFFLKSKLNSDGTENSESWFWQAKTAFGAGNIQSAGIMLEKAIQLSKSYDEKEKYIRQYFAFSENDQSGDIERITGTTLNESLPAELRSYANLILGDLHSDNDQRIENYNEVKKYFISAPENPLLKKFSAQADIKLSKLYIQTGPEEAVESILEYMIENYKGINYDLYSILARKTLSELYLQKAKNYLLKKMYDNALLIYTKAYELDNTNIEIIRGITDSYNNLRKINEAINFFSREFSSNENSAYLNYALGYCYSVRGTAGRTALKADITEAVRYLNRCIDIESSVKYAYLTLSFCYEALYHISVIEAENEKKKNVFLRSIDFITGPFKFLLEKVNIIEDTSIDNTDMAISLLGKGINLCDRTTDKELLLKMKLNMANNYYNMGEYARKQALDFYMQVIGEGYSFSSKEQEALIYERTGHCLFTLDDASAEEYYDKAVAIYKELNDRKSEIRISMRTALLYLTREDKEGDMIGGDDAYQKYSEILIKLKSEDNREAVNLIKRNSAFAKFVDEEYEYSSGITGQIISEDGIYKDTGSKDNLIILSILGLEIPVWKLDLILGSQYSEGFDGKDELALLYSIQASNYYNLKDFATIREILQSKSEIFRKKGNDLAVSLIENRLGIIEYFCGNYKESIKRFKNSNEYCTKLELNNVALTNENNILKAMTASFSGQDMKAVNQAVSDTVIYSLASSAEIFEKAVNRNLRGVLSFKSYKALSEGSSSDKYSAFRHLIRAQKLFSSADSILGTQPRPNEEKNRLTAGILYNLALSEAESGDVIKAKEIINKGYETAEKTYDKLLQWRYQMKKGDFETDPDAKLKLYAESEKTLSGYLPSTDEYELITGWKEDIKPLYDRIIEAHLQRKEVSAAMNYAERFKNRTLLNYYSSRYLDYKEQLHKIHVRKIRYNNGEILRYRQKAELLKDKNPVKYASLISEYEKQADFYEKELTDIYDQIKKSSDERLLQFVSIEDIDQEQLSELLGEYKAVISIYSLPDAELFFYYDQNGAQYVRSGGSDCTVIFNGFTEAVKEKEHVFIIPDIDLSADTDYASAALEKGIDGVIVTTLPTVSSLKMVTENANINYSELKKASETGSKDSDLSSFLENGGIIYIDKPVRISGSNALESLFTFGEQEVKLGEFLKLKIPAYTVIIEGFDGDLSPIDRTLLVNSLIFSGVQTVILPSNDPNDSTALRSLSGKLFERSGENDIITIIKESGIKCSVSGLPGMNKETQREFAASNLKSSLMNGVRYFNSKVYEKAAVYFLQALAMARNIGDKQELNILKTLTSSLSKIKDYKRAIIYGEQLVVYTEKNNAGKEKLLAYDALSKDYFRNKQYDKAADYQINILNDGKSELKNKLDAYDMLSVIYSYKGDLKSSISYKKEYLKYSQLIKSDDLSSFKAELDGKTAEVLFNSLRNIMVSFYKNGDLDSALYVYQTIIDNKTEFEDVNFDSFGELLESAGLCYFKKSDYKKAEDLYFEALDYFTEEVKKTSVYLNLSDLYYFTDKLSLAIKYLSEAEKLSSTDSEKMRVFNTRSLIEVKLDNIPSARTYSYKALEKTIEMNDRSEESTARVNMAKILILSDDIPVAQKNLIKSKELANETKNIKALLSAEFYQGEIFLENAKNPDSALFHYRKCLNLSISDNDEYFRSRALYRIGDSYFNKQQNDSSEYYVLKSLESADRFGFNEVYIKATYKLSEVYEKTQPDKALNMLEKLSERAEKLVYESDNRFADEYESIIRDGFTKRFNITIKSTQSEKVLALIRLRDDLMIRNDMKYFDLKDKIKAKATHEQDNGILKKIQNDIDNESAFLLFIPYASVCELIMITGKDMKTAEFKISKDMIEIPERIESKSDFISDAKKAYETVFTKDVLENLAGKTTLYIYTDGILKNYPFDVLYDGERFLIDRFNIAEINDISDITFKASAGTISRSLSFVNPFTAESELVYAEREYNSMLQVNKGSEFVTDKKATESLLKSDGIKSYKVLHFPVHSFVLSKDSVRTNDRSSYIQLSADGSDNGRLEWSEIIDLNIKDKEVILSGCDTGGKTGEEYYSHFDLSRAFGLAGSSEIISSKWKTDDLAASVLMKRYFRYSADGENRISALSKAKRDVRLYFNPHPYYWANFKISQ